MKKLIIIFIVLFSFQITAAQEWKTDFETAKKEAAKEDKPIVLVFQGSDWCAPCIKLTKEIWSTEEFKNYAQDHYVMLLADFPRRIKNALSEEQQAKNDKLAEKYNSRGYFPYVVILDEKGRVLGDAGYKKTTPKEYIAMLNSYIN
ncbi:thioredoxin family protein [Zunongwangia sp. F363]|uniref:Thioredoxin family protein n=1 Tax=Autumnicola tepida TaxID=3075595 RepID=A0ABU3C9T6_9FLAO|nr:thioredoxin family protein [Zunongwangia sp. F363]MDT0643099.1 thioredoxin family protein [Zunongwangia sp. F363]